MNNETFEEFAKLVDHVYRTHKFCHICNNINPTCLVPSSYVNDFTVHFMCECCMNSFLSHCPKLFQKIRKREITGKM